jgi:hypothetical protein
MALEAMYCCIPEKGWKFKDSFIKMRGSLKGKVGVLACPY